MACRASVRAFFECNPAAAGAHGPALLQQLLEFGTTARGEKLSAALVTVFVREGMKVPATCRSLCMPLNAEGTPLQRGAVSACPGWRSPAAVSAALRACLRASSLPNAKR